MRAPPALEALAQLAEVAAPAASRAGFDAAVLAALRAGRPAASEVVQPRDGRKLELLLGRAHALVARQVMQALTATRQQAASAAARAVEGHARRMSGGLLRVGAAAEELAREALARREAADFGSLRHLLARWATDGQQRVREAAQEGVRRMDTGRELLDRVGLAADRSWSAAERIVRTETAYAFNASADAAIADLARRAKRAVYKRWTERVNDTTGAPLDARVAVDSIVLHGQVAEPDGVFEMPRDARVDARLWGRRFAFPPNRPHDRAVLLPWMPGWVGGGWRLRGGRRSAIR